MPFGKLRALNFTTKSEIWEKFTEADGCWCACWTSNPDLLRKGEGRFDSYTSPPILVDREQEIGHSNKHPHLNPLPSRERNLGNRAQRKNEKVKGNRGEKVQ